MPKCECYSPPMPDRMTFTPEESTNDNPQPGYEGEPFAKNVPCNIITVSGDETFRGRQLDARVSHVVECRYFAGLSTTMRGTATGGLYAGRVFHIRAVKPIRKPNQATMQWVYCEEAAA